MSTAQIKKAYKSKRSTHLEPLSPSSPKKKKKKLALSLKAVEYDPENIQLPAVKMSGKPSIKNKLSEVLMVLK